MPTPHKEVTAADLIAEALDIWKDGNQWMRGAESDGHGRYCLIGGLRRAGRKLGAPSGVVAEAAREVTADIHHIPGFYNFSIPSFNDHERTKFKNVKETVCVTLKRLLKGARRFDSKVAKPRVRK